jgi:hypothetical protein
MGRPLNKKYFGNRNIGTTGTGDDNLGGEGVGSVTIDASGGYTSGLPTATFSVPDLGGVGGVRATGIVHGNGLSAATTTNGTGYQVGDVLTVVGGTRTSAATFPVARIVGLGTPGITDGGTLYDVTDVNVGDLVTFTHANFPVTPLIVRITAVTGSTATAIAVEQQGIWTGTGAFPTSMADGVNGFTATTTARSGGDDNGNGLILSFTGSNWGLYSFGTVAVQGDYTVAATNPVSFTGGTGTGAAATINFGVSGIEITEKGSGYISVSDAAITFGTVADGGAAATPVLTTENGTLYSAGNQENAIVPYAKTTSGGTSKVADIIRQASATRFQVRTADGTAVCALKASAVSAQGEMTITATDSDGGTYFVTKIGNGKATIAQDTGTQFADGASVKWVLGSAQQGYSVKLSNA